MKKFLIVLVLLSSVGIMYSQSVFSTYALSEQDPERSSTVFSPYFGASAGLQISGDGLDTTSLFFQGKFIKSLFQSARYGVPVVSTFSTDLNGIKNFLNNNFNGKGAQLGILPYYVVSSSANNTWILHGGVSYQVIPLEGLVLKGAPTRWLFTVGLEGLFYWKGTDQLPVTVGVSPEYSLVNYRDSKNMWEVNIPIIIPVSTNVGLKLDTRIPLGGSTSSPSIAALLVITKPLTN